MSARLPRALAHAMVALGFWAASLVADPQLSSSGAGSRLSARPPTRITPLPPLVSAELPPGIEYVRHRSSDPVISAHILRIARTNASLRPITTLAHNTVVGLESLSEQIRHLPLGQGRPVAGVNGDFFIIQPGPYQGDPRGLQIVSRELVSAPASTATFWIDSGGAPHLELVESHLHVRWPAGDTTPIALNQERTRRSSVLYTPTFGSSTRTTNGTELVLGKSGHGPWLPLQAGVTYQARVISRSHGNTQLHPETMVLSLPPHASIPARALQPGAILEINTDTTPTLRGVEQAISGGPILVHEGDVQSWSPPQPRHPRTALGWNATHFILAVVDGRQPGVSVGMSFPELAGFMRGLGCQEALNLDGGGSSTLWMNGRVLNTPSDGHERSVANGLVWVKVE